MLRGPYLVVVPSALIVLLRAEHTTALRWCLSPTLNPGQSPVFSAFAMAFSIKLSWPVWGVSLLDNACNILCEFANTGPSKLLHHPVPSAWQILLHCVGYRLCEFVCVSVGEVRHSAAVRTRDIMYSRG